jgi:calcineurin-like phosphoesterase family protein
MSNQPQKHSHRWKGPNPFSPPHPWIIEAQQKGLPVLLTADEHYRHKMICLYSSRPFGNPEEMEEAFVSYHNAESNERGLTIHVGDSCFGRAPDLLAITKRLVGRHLFMDGSHDEALRELATLGIPEDMKEKIDFLPKMYEFKFEGKKITLNHYKMDKFWCSHHQAFHFYGHSHGQAPSRDRSQDVGVDTNAYRPYHLRKLLKDLSPKTNPDNHLRPRHR